MKLEEIKINIKNRISSMYICLKLGYLESALALLYSELDSISWLYSSETDIEKRNGKVKEEFKKFVEDYFLPALPGYDISSDELYCARCSIVHTSSSYSSNQQKNRQFCYSLTKQNIEIQNKIVKVITNDCISINIKDLILAFKCSVENFLNDLSNTKIKEIDEKTKYWYVDCGIIN